MQDQGHGLQPVAYASAVNNAGQVNYKVTDLKCLAVVWSIKLFRPYIYGHRFCVMTNHSPLHWHMESRDLTRRLHQWALSLQEYDFDVVSWLIHENAVADALSRASVRVLGTQQITDERILLDSSSATCASACCRASVVEGDGLA